MKKENKTEKVFEKILRGNPKVFDIIALVKENPIINLSGSYESEMINKIKDNFNETEQQLFLSSFYCYLNNDPLKDFVIDLDDIWGWVGFSRKEHAKRLLKRSFSENKDYVIKKFLKKAATTVGVAALGEKNLGGAGKNKEYILLNIDTFKKFCIKADTDRASEIHDYYIKLEGILHETAKEQSQELTNLLKIKDETIKKSEKKLLKVKKQLDIKGVKYKEVKNGLLIKISENEQRVVDNFEKIVYGGIAEIVTINGVKYSYIKFGYTNNVEDRLRTHKKEIGQQFTFEIVIPSMYNIEIEKMIKTIKPLNQRIVKDDFKITKDGKKTYGKMINDKLQTEIIKLDDNFTMNDLRKELKKFKEQAEKNLEDENRRLELENMKLKERLENMEKNENTKTIDLNKHSMQNLISTSFELKQATCHNFLVDYITKEIVSRDNKINFIIKITNDEIFEKYKQFRISNGFKEPLNSDKYEKSVITKSFKDIEGISKTTIEIDSVSIRAKNYDVSKIVEWICKNINIPKRFRNLYKEFSKQFSSKNQIIKFSVEDGLQIIYSFLITLLEENKDERCVTIKQSEMSEKFRKFLLQNKCKKQTMTKLYKTVDTIPGITLERMKTEQVNYARVCKIIIEKVSEWFVKEHKYYLSITDKLKYVKPKKEKLPTGVVKCNNDKYTATCYKNYLGVFETVKEASLARRDAKNRGIG
jgi:regulator of replication initiation timing